MEKKCKYCAMMIAKEASVCPYCRKKQPLQLTASKRALYGFIALLVLGSIANISDPKPATPPSPEEIAARELEKISFDVKLAAQHYVKENLKSPSSAKFPSLDEFAAAPAPKSKKQKESKALWDVSGYVDAQNSYGAMLRNKFYCQLLKSGDGWVLVKMKIW